MQINYATHDNYEELLRITFGFHSSTQNLYNVNPTGKDSNDICFIKPSNFNRIKPRYNKITSNHWLMLSGVKRYSIHVRLCSKLTPVSSSTPHKNAFRTVRLQM